MDAISKLTKDTPKPTAALDKRHTLVKDN